MSGAPRLYFLEIVCQLIPCTCTDRRNTNMETALQCNSILDLSQCLSQNNIWRIRFKFIKNKNRTENNTHVVLKNITQKYTKCSKKNGVVEFVYFSFTSELIIVQNKKLQKQTMKIIFIAKLQCLAATYYSEQKCARYEEPSSNRKHIAKSNNTRIT
jgi:hypothetical protein